MFQNNKERITGTIIFHNLNNVPTAPSCLRAAAGLLLRQGRGFQRDGCRCTHFSMEGNITHIYWVNSLHSTTCTYRLPRHIYEGPPDYYDVQAMVFVGVSVIVHTFLQRWR